MRMLNFHQPFCHLPGFAGGQEGIRHVFRVSFAWLRRVQRGRKLGLFGFALSHCTRCPFARKYFPNTILCALDLFGNWLCFFKKRRLCRVVSTVVEIVRDRGGWSLYVGGRVFYDKHSRPQTKKRRGSTVPFIFRAIRAFARKFGGIFWSGVT